MRDFHFPGRSPVFATNGMCATSHPLAAKVAIQMLESGGNAMDAALAGAVLLGLCEPQMAGIGGDCFVLFTPPGSDRVIGMNGSGRAPADLSAAVLRDAGHSTMPVRGVETVTIPGAVDAFCQLSQDWGRIGLAATLAPAIHYARQGVPVAPRVAFDWRESGDVLKGAARQYYLAANETAPTQGTVFRSNPQADALEKIAMDGREGFYEGEVAEDMVNSLRALGGCHTLDDFAAPQCTYTDPVSGTYGGIELLEHPPNGQGAIAILMLNMLKNFDLSRMEPFGAERAHLEAEIAKLAYDARDRFIADPDHMSRLDHLLDPATADQLAALVNPRQVLPQRPASAGAVHKDTIYITVVDRDRMAVSLIYSIFHAFGSGLASDRFGVLFQNRGAGFSLTPGHPNEAGGGKRPMHTIIPAMVRQKGRVVMPFGVMGGAYQPAGHARFLTNMLGYGMDVQAAIDGPRCFPTDGVLRIERSYSAEVRQKLVDLGHDVQIPHGPMGGGQAIWIGEDGVLAGGSDQRKDGCALGY